MTTSETIQASTNSTIMYDEHKELMYTIHQQLGATMSENTRLQLQASIMLKRLEKMTKCLIVMCDTMQVQIEEERGDYSSEDLENFIEAASLLNELGVRNYKR